MDNIIQVNNLKKNFNHIKAVDDISFTVKRGQLYGFLGVNGAGKSTTINILCTLLKGNEGQVKISGYELGQDDREIRKRIGVVFQENCLDERLTVKENLIIRAALYNNSSYSIENNLNFVCEVLNIGDLLNRQFYKLSGGQKRRCELARGLMNRPEILFLDEPTTGLDPQTRQNVWNCIEALRNEENMTVFLTTHYMEEAAKAQYISIIDAGKLVANGTPSELKNRYTHDIIKLIPLDLEELQKQLEQMGIEYEIKSNHFQIIISDSLSGLDLLIDIKDHLKSFEVIQGTMDDVFLNITGKSL
jgi:multidrug/hemolysin transport system ATP-binding protein